MMITIVIIYMVVMLGVGWWCNKKYINGMSDFLLAGRKLGFWLCMFTLAATHFGGGCVIGGGEYGFKFGLSGVWYAASCGIGLLLLGYLTAYKFRNLSMFTVPDYLEHRYGSKTIRVLSAIISTIALTGLVGACTLAAKTAFSILGIEGNAGFYISAIVFLIYTTTGGLWAAALTDFIQLIIAVLGIIGGAIIVLVKTGGWAGLIAALAAKDVAQTTYFSLWGMGSQSIMWIILPTVMYTLIGQDFYQRLFSAKDSLTSKKSAIGAGILLLLVSIPPVIMGMGARALSNIENGAEAVPWVVQNLMSPIIGGIVLAAILAAVMSSADSLLTGATSHVVKDFWIEIFKKDSIKDEKKLLTVARISTVIIGIAAVIIAILIPSLVKVIIWSYTMYTASVFVPVIGGVLWKRGTSTGALASLIGGAVVTLWGILSNTDIFGFPAEIYGAVISLIIFVVVSLMTKPQQTTDESDKIVS